MTNEEVISKLKDLNLHNLVKPENCKSYNSPEAYLKYLVLELKSEIMYLEMHEMDSEGVEEDLAEYKEDLESVCKAFAINPDEVEVLTVRQDIIDELEERLFIRFNQDDLVGDPLLPLMQEVSENISPLTRGIYREIFNKHFSEYIIL